jgi:hypothetical protein
MNYFLSDITTDALPTERSNTINKGSVYMQTYISFAHIETMYTGGMPLNLVMSNSADSSRYQ